MKNKPIILITGPTGTGKSELALHLAKELSGEIINADMGQMYKPLTIGTAKPTWETAVAPHHLFDILTTPSSYTVSSYRQDVEECIKDLEARGKVAIVVGGSGFYIQALLWRLSACKTPTLTSTYFEDQSTYDLYNRLQEEDPQRSKEIHPHDRYRIERALFLLDQGFKPSECKPTFDPVRPFILIGVAREKDELDDRISRRFNQMIAVGWLQEVQCLDSSWRDFIREKKIIGYNELLDVEEGYITLSEAREAVIQETKNYAKRQRTFWRGLKSKVELALKQEAFAVGSIEEVNLTLSDHTLYIKQLIERFNTWKSL